MDTNGFIIRFASENDVERMLDIYEPYITDTTVTFEYSVPSCGEFKERFLGVISKYPWIVAEYRGEVIGYAYADKPFINRSAYAWDTDVSVYLADEYRGKGVGLALYKALHSLLSLLGYKNAYAVVTGENTASLEFHKRFGYRKAGTLHGSGFKLGRWLDVYFMEYEISAKENSPSPTTVISSLDSLTVRTIFENEAKRSKLYEIL